MRTTTPLLWLLLVCQPFLLPAADNGAPTWEAKIPWTSKKDPVALNNAFGVTNIPNRDIVESLKGEYGIKPYRFTELVPKAMNDGVFEVSVKRSSGHRVPPDMAGTGPFYLVKALTNYYALTERNFATLFGPIEKKEEVLPYLRVHEEIFGDRFATIVTEETAKKEQT